MFSLEKNDTIQHSSLFNVSRFVPSEPMTVENEDVSFWTANLKTNQQKVMIKCSVHQRTVREALYHSIAQQLAPKQVVPILDHFDTFFHGSQPRRFCIVTEYCAGGDLFDRFQAWRMTRPQAVHVAVVVASVLIEFICLLSTAPEPLIHRDLKPENIFLKRKVRNPLELQLSDVVVGDFEFTSPAETQQRCAGTEPFLHPDGYENALERKQRKPIVTVFTKHDIWSIGMIMLDILDGNALHRYHKRKDAIPNVSNALNILLESDCEAAKELACLFPRMLSTADPLAISDFDHFRNQISTFEQFRNR